MLVIIACEILAERNQFIYLGLIIHNNGEVEEDMTNKIKAVWLK